MSLLDVLTLCVIFVVAGVNVSFLLWLAALPGQIARDRLHPQTEAINVLGWLSLVTLFTTWPLALVWAYLKPANVQINEATPSSTVPGKELARP